MSGILERIVNAILGLPLVAPPPVRYCIHPAIGIARVGKAPPDTYFVGPEVPGRPAEPTPVALGVPPSFKRAGLIRPQAARFRIWEYRKMGGRWRDVGEVTLGPAEKIEWTVHLANRKASFNRFEGPAGEPGGPPAAPLRNAGVAARASLDIDPGKRTITAESGKPPPSPEPVNPAKGGSWPVPAIDYLGELRTDAAGRLVVIGGKGTSVTTGPSIVEFANNEGWFDDVSDGPVTARVRVAGVNHPVEPAWVLVAPPDFAPAAGNIVSLHDLLYDMVARLAELRPDEALYAGALAALHRLGAKFKSGTTTLKGYKVSFDAEIRPLLTRAARVPYVFAPAAQRHTTVGFDETGGTGAWSSLVVPGAASEGLRTSIFGRLRRPPACSGLSGGGPEDMPRLFGDEPTGAAPLTLTPTQYLLMRRYWKGAFDPAPVAPPPPSAAVTPWGLDQAALEHCAGGGFFPGIEVGWQIRDVLLFTAIVGGKHQVMPAGPFRINPTAVCTHTGVGAGTLIGPGYLTRQLAVPWQADFLNCNNDSPTAGGPVLGWWPAQRPNTVYTSAADVAAGATVEWTRPWGAAWPAGGAQPTEEELVKHWQKLGFLVERGGHLLEEERDSTWP